MRGAMKGKCKYEEGDNIEAWCKLHVQYLTSITCNDCDDYEEDEA